MFKQPFPGAVCGAARGLTGASGRFVSLSQTGPGTPQSLLLVPEGHTPDP